VHASGRAPLRQIMNAVEEIHTEMAGGHNEKASLQRFHLKIVRQESLHYTSANRSSNEIAKWGSHSPSTGLYTFLVDLGALLLDTDGRVKNSISPS
jgi:hypothetical protein